VSARPHFYCRALIAAVRAEPDHGSERVTEALLWDEVSVEVEAGDWWRVSLPSQAGYTGWLPREAVDCGRGFDGAEFIVVAASAPLSRSGNEAGECVGVLWMGTTVVAATDQPSGATVRLLGPDGEQYCCPTASLRLRSVLRGLMPRDRSSEALRGALSLIGTPYLWGGMTARGVDCSGLVQVAYRAVGVTLPRDADMQYDAARPVPREELRAGDAAFLHKNGRITHVMMMADRDRLVHAYGRPGQVQVNSLSDDGLLDRCAGFGRFIGELEG
jgi:hypothetical protein